MSGAANQVVVDAFSDLLCPWCYVVRARFANVRRDLGVSDRVDVAWRPVQLLPDAPPTPVPTFDKMVERFGAVEPAEEVVARLTEIAEAEGLEIDLRAAVTANTMDAHRLIVGFADDTTRGALIDRLYRAYFVEGEFLGDRGLLGRLAGDVGLDPDAAVRFLETGGGEPEIAAAGALASELEIVNLPSYSFGGRTVIRGAQPAEAYRDAVTDALGTVPPNADTP